MRPLYYIEGYCYFPLWLLVLIKKLAETFMSSQVSGNEVKLEWFLKWPVTYKLEFSICLWSSSEQKRISKERGKYVQCGSAMVGFKLCQSWWCDLVISKLIQFNLFPHKRVYSIASIHMSDKLNDMRLIMIGICFIWMILKNWYFIRISL